MGRAFTYLSAAQVASALDILSFGRPIFQEDVEPVASSQPPVALSTVENVEPQAGPSGLQRRGIKTNRTHDILAESSSDDDDGPLGGYMVRTCKHTKIYKL